MLSHTTLNHEQQDYLGLIQQSADSLLHLLNDILDFSKIEADKVELENVSFDLAEVIDEIAYLNADNAAKKSLELHTSYSSTVCEEYVGDPAKIRQVVMNLVSNSIKFTDTGEIWVRVDDRATESGKTNHTVLRLALPMTQCKRLNSKPPTFSLKILT